MEQEALSRASYWAVIPGGVMHDRDLQPNAKLLYGEISALTNQEGFCFASNAHFAELLGVEERTVRRWLAMLEKKGFIRIAEERGQRNVLAQRRIYAGINPVYSTESSLDKNVQTKPVRTKMSASSDKNVQTHLIENHNLENPPYSPPKGTKRVRPSQNKKQPDWKPERFAGLWNYYPVHTSKQAAIRAWDKLKPEDELIAEIGKALRRQMATDMWQRGVGIPYLATYLNQERWKDEVEISLPDAAAEDPGRDYMENLPTWT